MTQHLSLSLIPLPAPSTAFFLKYLSGTHGKHQSSIKTSSVLPRMLPSLACKRYELTGVVLGFGKGETSLKALIQIIDIALGDKEGRLSRNKLATIRRILEACYKEREDSRSNDRGNDGGGSGSGSGSSSDDDNPSGGALPLQVGSS